MAPQQPAPVGTTDTGETEYGDSSKGPDPECSRIEVKPTQNGGYAVQCFYKPKADRGPKDRTAAYVEPTDFAFSSFDELVTWMREELGEASGGDAAASDAGAAAGAAAGAGS